MTTLRREFVDTSGGYLLVTVNVETGEVRAATREHAWDTWSRPLPEWDRADDVEPGRVRGYDPPDPETGADPGNL